MQLDSALGFSFHSNKCQFFGCGVVSQRALHNVSEDLQLRWPVVGTFKLLGVHYNLLVETKFFSFFRQTSASGVAAAFSHQTY
jgi:hypothetical protein